MQFEKQDRRCGRLRARLSPQLLSIEDDSGSSGEEGTIDRLSATAPGRVGLLGAGGQAREIASYLPTGTDIFWAVSPGYLDEAERGQVDITAPPAADLNTAVIGAVGAPAQRRDLVAAWPGDRYTTVVSPAAYVDPSCAIGVGTVIAPGAILSVGVTVGEHCQVNIGATLSHDVSLASFITIGPGAHLAGRVRIGDGAFVGVGATISNDVTIAPGAVVGAGATVLSDVTTPNAVVVGVPAAVIDVRSGWLDAL